MIQQPRLPKRAKPKSHSTFRAIGLVLLFTVGIFSIIASITTSNKPTKVLSEDKSEREAVLLALQIQQVRLIAAILSLKGGPGNYAVHEENIAKHKTRLAVIDARAAKAISSDPKTCFPADMLVLTEEGARSIAEIKVGDRVLSINASGEQVPSEVLKTYAAQNYHYFLINHKIKATALHRFHTRDGWKRTHELEVGDLIQLNSGDFDEIISIALFSDNLNVYNLTISKNHNFFISTDGKSGYLVHNTAGGGGGGGGGGDGNGGK
jgi:hypothetical protein